MRILIVEDDPIIAQALADALARQDLQSRIVDDFEGVLQTFIDYDPHLVLMDNNLPYFNGYYWCNQIRAQSTVPIIFISSLTDQMDQVMAIQMGGDDYITKPIDLPLTMAKIQALLRRTYDFSQTPSDLKTFGQLALDSQKSLLTFQGQELSLTYTELQILSFLMQNGENYSRREDILDYCWQNDQFIDDNTLAVNISRLRKKLKDLGLDDLIITKKKVGYCLNKEAVS